MNNQTQCYMPRIERNGEYKLLSAKWHLVIQLFRFVLTWRLEKKKKKKRRPTWIKCGHATCWDDLSFSGSSVRTNFGIWCSGDRDTSGFSFWLWAQPILWCPRFAVPFRFPSSRVFSPIRRVRRKRHLTKSTT